MEKVKQSARLEEWFVGPHGLYGKVFDHPSIPDGKIVQTSRVVTFDKEKNLAITKNTEYVLGKRASDE